MESENICSSLHVLCAQNTLSCTVTILQKTSFIITFYQHYIDKHTVFGVKDHV